MLQNKYLPFWLLTFAFLGALILPVLVMDGMFMDGVLYAAVSKNLANGYGSMWWLRFSEFGFAEHVTFHEHPPLIFWIQSVFFKLFGDGMYTERIYSFFTCLFTAFLMIKTWKLITKGDKNLTKMSWLAIFLWMLIPVAFWAYQNNIQENTMGIFSLLSVLFALKAVHLKKRIWLNLFLSGIFIFCAGFSKGIPGLFTLGAVFFHWVFFRKQTIGKMVLQNLFVTVVCFGTLVLILLIPDANESLSIYFNDRLGSRVSGANEDNNNLYRAESHFFILKRMFWELLPLMIVSVITLLVYRVKKLSPKLEKAHYKWMGFFVVMGLCGSVPIMLTLVQKTFYAAGSLPYFAIAFALSIAPGMSARIAKIDISKTGHKVFKGITMVMVLGVIVVTVLQVGKVSRNKDVLHDLYLVDDHVPENTVINVHPSMHNEWDMRVYLVRYWLISLDFNEDNKHDYYLMNKDLGRTPDSTYVMISLPTKKYDLYKRIED